MELNPCDFTPKLNYLSQKNVFSTGHLCAVQHKKYLFKGHFHFFYQWMNHWELASVPTSQTINCIKFFLRYYDIVCAFMQIRCFDFTWLRKKSREIQKNYLKKLDNHIFPGTFSSNLPFEKKLSIIASMFNILGRWCE